eukprot:1583048-Rhodomonas_salina.2
MIKRKAGCGLLHVSMETRKRPGVSFRVTIYKLQSHKLQTTAQLEKQSNFENARCDVPSSCG